MAELRGLAAALAVHFQNWNAIPARMPKRLARINWVHGNMGEVHAFVIEEAANLADIGARGIAVEFNVWHWMEPSYVDIASGPSHGMLGVTRG